MTPDASPSPSFAAHCPRCGGVAVSQRLAPRAGVTDGHYLCADSHVWLVRWATV